jgi:hypothetical protein
MTHPLRITLLSAALLAGAATAARADEEPSKIDRAASAVGHAASTAATKTGHAVKHAAEVTGAAVQKGAEKTGEFVRKGVDKTGEVMKRGGEKLQSSAKPASSSD